MTNLRHVYLTAHGSYPSGSWVGESAQIGVRIGFAPVVGGPAKGDIWTPLEGGAISPTYGTQAGANGTLAKTWTARVGDTGSLENFDAGAQIDAAEDMRAFLNSLKVYQDPAFRWTHIKCAAVDSLGKTPVVASIYTLTAPIVGSGSNALPPQVAMAVSSRANLVGRRGRGRVYIPALAASILAADGTIAGSASTAMRTGFKTLIDALQATPGFSTLQPIYFVGSADSATVVRPVEVRTGNRLDTIQSRRRQVAEAYTTLAL
jgi:hypothetical protein